MVNKWIGKIIPENFYDTKVRVGRTLWRFSNVFPFVSSLPHLSFRVASRDSSVFPQIRH
jgi:hypothetical protein